MIRLLGQRVRGLRVVLPIETNAKESRDANEHHSRRGVEKVPILEVEHPENAQGGGKEWPHKSREVELPFPARCSRVARWDGCCRDVHVYYTARTQATRGQGSRVVAQLSSIENEPHQPLALQLGRKVPPVRGHKGAAALIEGKSVVLVTRNNCGLHNYLRCHQSGGCNRAALKVLIVSDCYSGNLICSLAKSKG